MGKTARVPSFFHGILANEEWHGVWQWYSFFYRVVFRNENKEAVSLTSKELLEKAVDTLSNRKAEDLTAIEIGNISIIADYFLLATGNSTTQVKSLAEEVEFQFSQIGIEPLRTEGMRSGTWAVLDYGGLVVHIFHRETREFYNLERLWADGERIDIQQFIKQEG